MKTFLYLLTSLREGKKDNQYVIGGTHYHHQQLLAVIDALDAEQAARALNTTIVGSFDRSSVNCPTIYYTSSYFGPDDEKPHEHKEGYFFLSLKELEPFDNEKYPELPTKLNFKITARQDELATA